MKGIGVLLGYAAIIMAIGFSIYLSGQNRIAMEKAKTTCVCKE